MKANKLGILAALLAVALSSFKIEKKNQPPQISNDRATIVRFALFSEEDGAVETDFAEYTFSSVQPTWSCPGIGKVCWFKMEYNDDGDNIVEAPEFNLFVDGASLGLGFDVDRDDVINDDHNETAGVYQECGL